MNFSRFKEPTARDDMQRCQGQCGRIVHVDDLDEDSICGWCREDDEKEEDENE